MTNGAVTSGETNVVSILPPGNYQVFPRNRSGSSICFKGRWKGWHKEDLQHLEVVRGKALRENGLKELGELFGGKIREYWPLETSFMLLLSLLAVLVSWCWGAVYRLIATHEISYKHSETLDKSSSSTPITWSHFHCCVSSVIDVWVWVPEVLCVGLQQFLKYFTSLEIFLFSLYHSF